MPQQSDAAYFAGLNAALREDGPGHPVLILDLDRLEQNCAAILARWPQGKALRVVAKSLPCLPLLAFVLDRMGTQRQMIFHAPFVMPTLNARPMDDLLIGKPLPLRAAEHMFATGTVPARALAERVTWLIDTWARLEQYAGLARAQALRLRIALEIDIGMRRGGFTTPEELRAVVAASSAMPLDVVALMGYDAHVGAAPRVLQDPDEAHAVANAKYRAFAGALGRDLVLNGAGSRTFRRHGADSPLNELAVGSAFVMPARFDEPLLRDLRPAIFVATPVLRAQAGTTLPGFEWAAPLWSLASAKYERSYFIYGGRYDASYAWPPGLIENRLYGGSYNQTLVHASGEHPLAVDDYVFLRPNDSEAVMLQLGDLWVVRRGRLSARWPVLQPWT